jgi:deoxyribodipyrimidine photo-lyase
MNHIDSILWFRQDLRLSDNPALIESLNHGRILPIYILDDSAPKKYKRGSASRLYLYNSLKKLNDSLNGDLNLYIGDPKQIIIDLVRKYNINHIAWNRSYEPWFIENDKEIKSSLGIRVSICNGSYLWHPKDILKDDGSYYKVFTAYKNKALTMPIRQTIEQPSNIITVRDENNKTVIEDLKLTSSHEWYDKVSNYWEYGEEAAKKKLSEFLSRKLAGYKVFRNHPSKEHTSLLSPNLHFGEISPNQIWDAVHVAAKKHSLPEVDVEHFISELIWREFSCYLMAYFKNLHFENFQSRFNAFSWKYDHDLFKAWKHGKTGIPIVDAGMRELWETGYMHNRVRMITASFLVKNLMIHWHYGRDWFWECLVDADLANNSASWQWVAGSGADAAPYFRIFNPVIQGEKFDPEGLYIRKYVPELRNVPSKYIFDPSSAPKVILKECGVVLGVDYPYPIVDLKTSRDAALSAFKEI